MSPPSPTLLGSPASPEITNVAPRQLVQRHFFSLAPQLVEVLRYHVVCGAWILPQLNAYFVEEPAAGSRGLAETNWATARTFRTALL